jgi:hypothetical protein
MLYVMRYQRSVETADDSFDMEHFAVALQGPAGIDFAPLRRRYHDEVLHGHRMISVDGVRAFARWLCRQGIGLTEPEQATIDVGW